MAALGYAATGFGQGMLQNREIARQQQAQDRQYGLAERGIALQEQGQAADQKWREREAIRQELGKIDQILANPNALTPQQLKQWQNRRAGIVSQFPDLDYEGRARNDAMQQAEQQVKAAGSPYADLKNPSITAPPATGPLYDTGMQDQTFNGPAPEYVPPPPQQGPPAPADYQPITDQQVSSLMRETDPNFNIAQNARMPQPPPAGGQPPTQAQITPPPQAAPQAPPQRDSVREYHDYLQTIIADPNASVNDKRNAYKEMIALEQTRADLRTSAAEAGYKEALTSEVAPNARLARAAQLEEIAMSRYKRLEYMPKELQAIIAKAKAGATLDPSDLIALERLNFDIKKLGLDRQDAERDRTYNRSLDAAKFDQTERLAAGQQNAAAETQVRGAVLKGIMTQYTEKNPVTGAVKAKPGLIEALRAEGQRLSSQGQGVDVIGSNPGFSDDIWSAVNTPGFNANNAIAAARSAGDTNAVNQIKSAVAIAQRLQGAISRPGAAPTAGASRQSPGQNDKGGRYWTEATEDSIINDPTMSWQDKVKFFKKNGRPIPPRLAQKAGIKPTPRVGYGAGGTIGPRR